MSDHDDHWFAHAFEPDDDADPAGGLHDGWADEPWVVEAHGPDDDLPRLPVDALHGHGDVLAVLLHLVGPERAGPPALWFLLLDDEDRCLPLVLPVNDVPLRADPAVAAQVMTGLASVLEREAPGGSLVVACVRAGGGDRGAFESSWAAALREAADDRGLRVRAVAALGANRARVLEW
jgi:hypothetical protein